MMYLDTATQALAHPFVLMLLGLMAHFGRKILAAVTHDAANKPCLTDYWRKNPIQTVISVTGALAGYAMFAHFPDFDKMSPEVQNVVRVTAFGIGYMADSVVDAVGTKTKTRIEGVKQ